jgi:hypothetical protein
MEILIRMSVPRVALPISMEIRILIYVYYQQVARVGSSLMIQPTFAFHCALRIQVPLVNLQLKNACRFALKVHTLIVLRDYAHLHAILLGDSLEITHLKAVYLLALQHLTFMLIL